MRKILLFLPLLVLSAAAHAQTNDQYQNLFNKIDALISNYIEYSTLNTTDQPKVTDASINRFISLFTSENAMVDYDLKNFSPAVTYHEVSCYPVKKYCQIIAEHNPMGLKYVKLLKADIDYKPLASESKVRVLLLKRMGGNRQDKRNTPFETSDNTILMTLKVSDDMGTVKIDSIIVVDPPISNRVGIETTDMELLPGQAEHVHKARVKSTLPSLFVGIDIKGGTLSQSVTAIDMTKNYNNLITDKTAYSAPPPHFSSGSSFGFDAQLEYYFGKNKHIGLGAGIAYFSQKGTMQMDNFHVEYESKDSSILGGNTFRQVVTAENAISEQLTITNINIPILLKYKTQLSEKWGFAADAGVLFNMSITNSYTTNASFNYGAIYAFSVSGTNSGNNNEHYGGTAIYDAQPIPGASDWVINNPAYTPQQLDAMAARGYNVGQGKTPATNTGTVSYTSGSIGFIIQPALTYKVSKGFFLNFGVYYMSQNFSNTANNANYMITDRMGSYNSILNSLSGTTSSSIGINIGAKIAII